MVNMERHRMGRYSSQPTFLNRYTCRVGQLSKSLLASQDELVLLLQLSSHKLIFFESSLGVFQMPGLSSGISGMRICPSCSPTVGSWVSPSDNTAAPMLETNVNRWPDMPRGQNETYKISNARYMHLLKSFQRETIFTSQAAWIICVA